MIKIKSLIIFILIVAAFVAGIYFKDDAISIYKNLNTQVKNFQKLDIGLTLSEAGKQIFLPPPLQKIREQNQVVLLKSKIIEQTNLQRQQNGGLPSLKENAKLDEAAAAKANDMFVKQYFEHVSPTGVDPGKLVQNYGYDYVVAGENLILGNFSSEQEVVQDWMNSPGHRANILNNRYSEIGVSIIKGTYKGEAVWIGVQEFGLPLANCNQPNSALKLQVDSEKIRLDALASQISVKLAEVNNTSPHSAIYSQMVDDYNQLIAQYNSLADQVKRDVADYNGQVSAFNNCIAGK